MLPNTIRCLEPLQSASVEGTLKYFSVRIKEFIVIFGFDPKD